MNLFLVTSPLQLLCAIEAKYEFKTSNNILICRLEKFKIASSQMNLLLDKSDWDHIIFIGRKNKIWEMRKLQSKLQALHPSLIFDHIFYADYSAWRTNVILNNIIVNKEVMFDDGVATIRVFYGAIQSHLIESRNTKNRDLLLKLVGLKPSRQIYPRNNLSFFTFFDLPNGQFKVTKNNLATIQCRLNISSCYDERAPVGFIGQGMVAEKGINLPYYEQMLRNIIQENNVDMVYFPHRSEKSFVKDRLQKIEGLIYHEPQLPIELEIADKSLNLSKIYAVASTASFTLEKLYPLIPIIDLRVPSCHYLIEEFGDGFNEVAKYLKSNVIELS